MTDERTPTRGERESLLKKVSELVEQKFFDPAFDPPKWRALVEERRDRILNSESPEEFERQMHELVVQLGSSHTAFYHRNLRPAPARQAICATVQECATDRGPMWLFQAVQEGGPAYEAGVRDGDLLVSVENGEVRPPSAPLFKVGTAVALQVRRPDGTERGIKVSIPKPDKPSQPFVQPKPVVFSKLDSGVGLLKVNIFPGIVGIDFARDIDDAIRSFGNCRALIIDLRGNSGGGMGGLRLMSYLTPSRLPIGYSLTRNRARKGYRREELRQFDRIPRRKAALLWLALRYGLGDQSIALFTEGLGAQTFHGRVAILVNANTASASEIVAAFAQENCLAKIVGTRSAGRLVASRRLKLHGGYFLSLPVGAYLTWSGKMLEKVGVEPDVPVDVTYEDVVSGRDPQLEAAVATVSGDRPSLP